MNDSELVKVLDGCWGALAEALTARNHAFKNAVLATVGPRSRVFQRTVVLRDVDSESLQLVFHTDARSEKFSHIQNKPQVSLLFWDEENRQQIRIEGDAKVHRRGKFADSEWHRTPVKSRTIYSVVTPPGTVTDGKARFLPRELSGINIDPAALQRGRPNFAAIRINVLSIDWLHIKEREHRRASFVYGKTKTDTVQANWIGA